MYTSRALTGATLLEQLNPPFRIVDFADEAAVVTVSHYLREAWGFMPDPSFTNDSNGIGRFMRESQSRALGKGEGETLESNEKWEAMEGVEVERGEEEVESEWRKAVLSFWNHVFFDVVNFLSGVGMGIGHFHPPSHDSLVVDFPGPDSDSDLNLAADARDATQLESRGSRRGRMVRKSWDTNVLLIPTHLAPSVKLRVMLPSSDGSEEELLGAFDHDAKTVCWWLRQGVEVQIYVDVSAGEEGKGKPKEIERKGVAAVLAVGVLCDDTHPEEEEGNIDVVEEVDGQEILEAELQLVSEVPVVVEVH